MKNLFILTILSVVLFSCKKEESVPPNSVHTLRVLDITPQIYAFVKGKWEMSEQGSEGSVLVEFTDTTLTRDLPKQPVGDKQKHLVFKYTLIRNQNVNEILLTCISDTSFRDFNSMFFEIREDNSFYLNSLPYRRGPLKP